MRRHIRRWLGPLLALALVGGALASASVSNAAEVGVNVTSNAGMTSPKVIADLRASKPAWVRVFLVWSYVEPTQGNYSAGWVALYQHFFASLPAATRVDIDVVGTPGWANGGSSSITAPPVNDSDYAGFLNYLVNAFHGRVAAWEIWNEESSPNWWSGTPAQYASLLKATYPSIKSADPKATVIVGANSPTFLSALYADGAKGSFDALAIHTDTACSIVSPYVYEYNKNTTTVNQYFFLGFTGIHSLMAANGDGSKPIYMTEIGWSSVTGECTTGASAGQKAAGVTEATQATYLQQAYHCIDQPQYPYIKAAMWFDMYNGPSSTAPLDNYGLLNADFSPKPAYAAWQAESLHGDQLTGPCGNFAGPRIRILHPTPGLRFSGGLKIAVSASSPSNGVREITIQLARGKRVHFLSKHFPATFRGSIAWKSASKLRLGPHTIKITVTDKLGNTSTAKIRVVHMKAPLRQRRHG